MTREETEAFFARRQGYWAQRDAAALAADHAPDGVLESPTAGFVTGRAAIQKVYAAWFAAFPDLEFRGEGPLVDGNRAALVWKVVGTHVGEFLGLTPTGRKFQVRGVFLYTLNGPQITHERRIYDFTGMLVQIGVLKAKPAASP